MRVTNNITTGQFLRNNNRALTTMLKSHNRIMTQRRFNRVSEDSINGSKTMTIRRQLRDLDMYEDNLSTAKELFSAAETNLMSIAHDIYIKVEEKLVAATNGTYDQMDLNIFAVEFDELAEHMVETLNGDFAERQLFGGTSNDPIPFSVQKMVMKDSAGNVVFPPNYDEYAAEGKLADLPKVVTYNGIPINVDINDATLTNGTYTTVQLDDAGNEVAESVKSYELDFDEARLKKDSSLLYPGSKPIYIDIGLGIKYNENYEVDPQTALDISMNGAKITGCGVDEGEGGKVYSQNLIQLVLDAATALRNGDQPTANAIIDRAKEANNHILTQITTLGTKQSSIEFYLNKTEDYRFNLKERQNLVEGTDMEAEITNYEAVKAAYDATLKIGAQLLPHSIFDFI